MPTGFWHQAENRRRYMQWLGKQLGFRQVQDWHRVRRSHFNDHCGGGLLSLFRSYLDLLRDCWPEIDWGDACEQDTSQPASRPPAAARWNVLAHGRSRFPSSRSYGGPTSTIGEHAEVALGAVGPRGEDNAPDVARNQRGFAVRTSWPFWRLLACAAAGGATGRARHRGSATAFRRADPTVGGRAPSADAKVAHGKIGPCGRDGP